MSIEAIKEKVMSFVSSADDNALERLSHFIDTENAPDRTEQAPDWWDQLPDEVKASVEEGIREADAGETITMDEFKQQYPQWFRR